MSGLNEWYEKEKTDGRQLQAPSRNVSSAHRPQSGLSSVGQLHGLGTFGLTTEEWADQKTPALIQTALQQSSYLKLSIANKVGTIPVSKNYHHYGSDAEFVHAYLKLNKIVVPSGPQEKALTDNVRAFYHRPTDSIHLRPQTHFGAVLQMAILKYSSPGFAGFFGEYLASGVGLYFTNLVLWEQGLAPMKSPNLKDRLDCATDLVGVAGVSFVGKAYFQNHSDLINYLTTKLSIGPVPIEKLTKNDLCTTLLLRTAQLANHDIKNMVGVGMTGPDFVRLWMRTEVPGMHELQIIKGKGFKSSKIMIPPENKGDNTLAITYPPTSEPKLEPRTKYRFRVVRTSDAKLVGEGSFETSPANDGDTPQKVVIGLVSCHQPFTDRGAISPEAKRMLSVLPRILKENDVKFVLPCGDQMYADEPGSLSLFNCENPFLMRHAFHNQEVNPKNIPKDITQCNVEKVRRLYDLRYRMFWSMPAIREMYANYPCYPTLDDHEIKNGWGSDPIHSRADFEIIKQGALDAYLDYQASSVLPPPSTLGMRKPSSFHYNFSYGNIGVFVMDLRSKRNNLGPRVRQMFSPAQLEDLRVFLQNNGNKKVLLIVSSVPVVFVPGLLARISRRVHIKESNFADHWSHPDNIRARDKFLSMLHAHQQAHPSQRVALLCGDVHIGNAFGIHWQGGNKPRLYQFTSSALTALETQTTQFLVEKGPRLVSGVTCPSTEFGGACSATVSHLPGMDEARSNNPFVGLNFGIIEVQRSGDVSNLKFKLVGYDPKEDRPFTYFESGYLG
ncbi:MAG TPA: alkaline phosphatase D family protein [Pyrinomonadaceae bacterium]|nr:alkaline phosphatase D family protein [Pyrinomonadaceae bacterium]